MTIPSLKTWLEGGPQGPAYHLALHADTTVGHLYQLAGGHRSASSGAAIRLEEASQYVRALPGFGDMPELRREDLAAACGGCEFARRCRGS